MNAVSWKALATMSAPFIGAAALAWAGLARVESPLVPIEAGSISTPRLPASETLTSRPANPTA